MVSRGGVGGQMQRRLKWLALVPGVLCLALALMALAGQRGPGLTGALFLALFFLSVPVWGRMRITRRIVAGLSPARLLTAAVVAVALVLSSCTAVPPAREPLTGRAAAAMELPPGGLVDSAPNFGWTQGKFSVSDDGAAQYSVPLWVPAGRGAVTPQLSLSYSSRAGNGLLGVGWSLGGLSTISWCGRTIAQDGYTDGGHFDGTGPLCLNGSRLVPISPPWSPRREYRTEHETFARIIAYETQDNVPDFFKVFTKDGKILTFGGSTQARVQPYLLMAGSNMAEPSLVRAPETRATTAWALDKIEDRNGNAATIEYTRTEGDAAGLWWMQLLPSQISYAPNRSVRFIYEGRLDKIDGFAGGTHTRTAVRMSRIEMRGGPADGTAELLREYRIRYQEIPSITGRSLLHSVTECDGADRQPDSPTSPTRRCKLPLPFEYSLGSYKFKEIDAGASEPTPVTVVDINGDGRSDLIGDAHHGPDLRVARSQDVAAAFGDGFNPPSYSGLPGTSEGPTARTAQTLDVDADGRPDALAEVGELGGYRYQLFQPTQNPSAKFARVPGNLGEWRSANTSPRRVYLADLDGSGLPDFVETASGAGEPWSYRLNTGAAGASRFALRVKDPTSRGNGIANFAVDTDGDGRTELISERRPGQGWKSWGLYAAGGVETRLVNLVGGPTITHFGDVNGDGLADAVIPHGLSSADPGELRVQLNSGNGFGSRLTAPSPPGYQAPNPFPASLRDDGVRVVDFNGDGRDDVLVFHGGNPRHGDTRRGLQVYMWTDNAFVRADLDLRIGDGIGISWENTQVLDLNGDGALDLVNAGTDGRLRVFQRVGGVPDQLIGIGNGSPRGRTEITYTTLADRRVHTPGTCAYPLTCPVSGGSVVAEHRVTSDFGTGTEATWDIYRHTYKAARADLHGRGWLGFAEHTVTRVATGATTVTEFENWRRDPGTKAYPFAQLPKKQTYTVKDVNDATGREFRSTTVYDYAIRPLGSGTYTVEQRHATADEKERPVGASQWQTLRQTATETSYDEFGNPDVVTSATTGGRKLTQDHDYRNNTGAWLIGLPTRAVSTGCTSAGVCTTRESTFDYDDKGNPTVTVVEPDNPALKLTTTTGYGPFGVVTSVTRTDNAGHSRTDRREYDNADKLYPTATINAAGHRTLIDTHSGLGVPLRITDLNGVPTTFRYDRFGRLRETNRADGSFERISHANLGNRQLTTTTVAGGGETAELVDQLGQTRERRVTAFDGRTATTYTDYDPLGRGIWRTSRPALPGDAPQYTVTRYDNRGRVTSVTAPDGAQVRHKYVNRETHTYDAKHVHSYTTDTVDGQVGSRYEDDPNSANWLHTKFEYGPFGETTKITAPDPDRTAQIMHYDPLGRRNRLEDPSSGTTITTYNAFGEVASVTDAENRITTFTYDPLGRVKKVTSPDGVATNTWDTAAHGKGKLDKARSADGVTTRRTYNELGQAATTTWAIEGTRYEFGYGYDNIGRLDCITYPAIPGAAGRLTVGQVYNPHGYLAQVKDGCEAGGEVYWAAEARNGAGQLERERLGNGMVTTRAYQPATGLLDHIVTTGPGTAGKVGELVYQYDDNRNVRQRDDLAHQRAETYHYDTLNRLDGWSLQHTGPAQPVVNATYTYDSVGNLKTETVQRPDQPEKTTTYRYGEDGAPPHALTSRDNQKYGYNRAGQQTSGPRRTVQYNTSRLPTMLNWGIGQGQARHTEFAYDPDGARALKRDADQTIITVAGLFERRAPAGTGGTEIHNLHNIVVDGRVVAQVNRIQAASGGPVTNTRTWYLHDDQQGSTTLTSGGNGQLAAYFYDPFGQRTDQTGKPLGNGRRDGPRQGYTGHEHDDEYGLINMKGRIYDPTARRFLTPDPIQGPVSSQSLNRYSYVQNNPATLTDPTGYLPPTPGPDKNYDPFGVQENGRVAHCVVNPSPFEDCSDVLLSFAEDPTKNGSLHETPKTTAAAPTPSSDDDTARPTVEVSEYSQVFQGSASRFKDWVGDVIDSIVDALSMSGTANAPGIGQHGESRPGEIGLVVNFAIAGPGSKIAGKIAGKVLGKTLSWAKGFFKPGVSAAAEVGAGADTGLAAGIGAAEEGASAMSQMERVGSGLKGDVSHRSVSWVVDNPAAQKFTITGGDGVARDLYQLPGELNGKPGIYEWIVDGSGSKPVITHQRFIPGGSLTGGPNQ
jgi:RHS repeat-associated protein